MAELGLNDDYRDLLLAFADNHTEFLLIGGWALAVHGYGRSTDDLDVLVRANPENAERVYRALATFGAPVAAHGVTANVFAAKGHGYRMGIRPNLIEVLTQISGVDFDEAWQSHTTLSLEGRVIPVIGRKALLANKRAAGRPKDLADVAWLEAHGDSSSE